MPQLVSLRTSVEDFRLLLFEEESAIAHPAGAMSANQNVAWTRQALAEARPTSGA